MEYLILLAASPLTILLLHTVLTRALRPRSPHLSNQLLVLLAIATGAPLTTLGAKVAGLELILRGPDMLAAGVYGFLVYGSLAYSYFHFFNLSETSRRGRILYELKRNGPMSAEALARRYPPEGQIPVRLERLVALRQLECGSGRYRLKGRILWLAAFILMAWGEVLGFRHALKEP